MNVQFGNLNILKDTKAKGNANINSFRQKNRKIVPKKKPRLGEDHDPYKILQGT
jgi:hypothetical protein